MSSPRQPPAHGACDLPAPEAPPPPSRSPGRRRLPLALALLPLVWGCSGDLDLPFFTPADTPRGRYAQALEQAGLASSALALDWTAAADSALETPVEVNSPYAEEGFLDPAVPTALAYRVTLSRGQRLRVETELEAPDSSRVFVEVFRADSVGGPERVLAPEPGAGPLEYEPRRGAELLVRVQPELLRGGRYRITLVVSGALAFPVEGRGMQSILSFFGDDREAGRRVHHGVDVFAPRGTPVLAVSDGVVTRVGDQRLGGNVVWVRDEEREINQYYAHLDTQSVEVGARVRAGDTLGTVGNTGNARTTPPHLHFGLYQRGEGPVDPWFFLLQPEGEAPVLALADEALRGWVRTRDAGIRIRNTPTTRGEVVEEVAVGTPLEVMAGVGEWMRVRLPDGRGGFILGRLTEPAGASPGSVRAGDAQPLRSLALPHAPVVGALDPGEGVEVLGSFGEFLLVRNPGGRDGWMSASAAES
jgi:peptidoglycan LD-endopeptidase LytH